MTLLNHRQTTRKRKILSPGRVSMLSYAVLILLGAILLLLPASTEKGHLDFIDALFTSASAVCVTGLIVVDTASTFTLFGKVVIIALIQVGGLGIMVLSTIFLVTLGKRVSMTGRQMLSETYSYGQGKNVYSLVKEIVIFTFIIELIGAALMLPDFLYRFPVGKAIGYAAFHSVSAFCNAGFSLFPDSFTRYGGSWLINLDICFLIISGGIGFIVMAEIRQKCSFSKGCRSKLSLHTRLTLTATLILLVGSTLLFFILEWSNTLKDLPLHTKFLASFFQAVNTRTAGFNTLDIGSLANETLFISILLMFVGTAPGSCGGGVKVTTISAIAILGYSRFRGQEHPHIFYRRISDASISKAVSLILISMLVIVISVVLLQQTEIGGVSHHLTRGSFLEIFYEVVSAFGTVGLSTGITAGFSGLGKLIIICIMFIGRLGPMGIAIAVSRKSKPSKFSYAQENIMIG
ncbi:MAG TPA: TrkH family potassium uptake protein [Desulfobacter sp.]|nr:TrkH family potassium uptake protein [Desulfobacter sp.]